MVTRLYVLMVIDANAALIKASFTVSVSPFDDTL